MTVASPIIDMRSDTVTKPTDEMYEAMRHAPIGDDGYRDDPTVLKLESLAARMTGKQAALFVPSGTMANLVAVFAWARPDGVIIAESQSHVVISEMDGAEVLARQKLRRLAGRVGRFDLAQLRTVLNEQIDVSVVCVENTHTASGGRVLDRAYTAELRRIVGSSTPIHLDGARIFNAAAKLSCDVATLCVEADSVSIALSKGLSAPVGSLLCGSDDIVARARKARKMLGGGMRQAGVVAAAGIVALTSMTERLADDNDRARRLASTLSELAPGSVDPSAVDTNIVLCDPMAFGGSASLIAENLQREGVLVRVAQCGSLRFVLHRQITDAETEKVVAAVARVVAEARCGGGRVLV
jgi:threonine aldolase